MSLYQIIPAPIIGKWYISKDTGRRLQLIADGILGQPDNWNPLLNIEYWKLKDEEGKEWYIRKVRFAFEMRAAEDAPNSHTR